MKKKKILIFTFKEGHLSLAQAAREVLEKEGFQTSLVNLFSQQGVKLYMPFYRYFPSLFKIPFRLGQTEPIETMIRFYLKNFLEKKVRDTLKTYQPDLIISTYLFYRPSLEKVLDYQKTPLPFVNITADPWEIHRVSFSPQAQFNLVYDQKGVALGKKNKVDPEKLTPVGWLVREKFYQKQPLARLRRKLGFEEGVFTLLICGGSEGTNMILKILPSLLASRRPLQVMVVCGTNKALYKSLLGFKKLIERSRRNRSLTRSGELNLKVFGFTDQLPQLMGVADLVIGKAGPNLIFETVAAGRPFFAICHIAGQEDANLNLIKEKRLGFVRENPVRAARLLRRIINDPAILSQFRSSIAKERQRNLRAGERLLQIVQSLI